MGSKGWRKRCVVLVAGYVGCCGAFRKSPVHASGPTVLWRHEGISSCQAP